MNEFKRNTILVMGLGCPHSNMSGLMDVLGCTEERT